MEMRVAVVDVGSNTTRLLVAALDGGMIEPLETGRFRLPLGEEIERTGRVSDTSIAAVVKAVRQLCAAAQGVGASMVDVFVTAPGRQAENADELLDALRRAANHRVRVLTTEEEGRLAYAGAVATAGVELGATIAVCDVGGASTEIAVGVPGRTPEWVESVDLGSVRLTARAAHLADARVETARAFADVEPPRVDVALTVGGSARATRRLVGPWLGDAELEEALRLVEDLSPRQVARRFGVDRARACILPAGVAILAHVHELLGVPLHVCSGGIREGAVLQQVAEAAA
jgi:exopolyphosphatase / guanosine-5'-triphosphate,3'-diphosphate pyrophosphatase